MMLTATTACSSKAGQGTNEGDSNAPAAEVASNKNAVVETIMARRSVRKYTDQIIPREDIATIVECGINAPSGMNQQPWEVRVVDNQELIAEMTKANGGVKEGERNMFRNATTLIFVANKADGGGALDCGLLGENMAIAAQSMGYGSCFLGGPVRFFFTEKGKPFLEKLQFSPDYRLLYILGLGYPAEAPDAKPRDAAKVKYVE